MKLIDIPEYVEMKAKLDAIKLPEGADYHKRAIINIAAKENQGVLDLKERLNELYDGAYVTVSVSTEELEFSVNKTFDDREALLAFVDRHSLVLPKEVTKYGRVNHSTNLPYTQMIYEIVLGDTFLNLSYERDGLPTKKCRIVPSTSFDVCCDVDGNDNGEAEEED